MFGKTFTASQCSTDLEIVSSTAVSFGGGILVSLVFNSHNTERYYAIFINGRFLKTIYVGENPTIQVVLPINTARNTAIYIEDVGLTANPDPDLINRLVWHAQREMALTADKIEMDWTNDNSYTLTPVLGDNQLTNIVVTGARRNTNLTSFPERPTRSRMTYSIKKIGAQVV